MSENVTCHLGAVLAELGQFQTDECADAYVLEAYRVDHPAVGIDDAGWRSTFHGLEGEALGDDAAETVQVDNVGELDAVTKGARGGDDRVAEGEFADVDGEVNSVRGGRVRRGRVGRAMGGSRLRTEPPGKSVARESRRRGCWGILRGWKRVGREHGRRLQNETREGV